MKTRFLIVPSVALCFAMLVAPSISNAQVRQYTANFAGTAPTVDGVLGDGEWGAAADGGGEWTVIRTARVEDDENNRFRVVWDQEGLYILGESDYDFWADDISGQNPAPSDFFGDFLNVFLDPNTLGEDNIGQLDEEIDNYQIGFNIYADARSCGDDRIPGTEDDCTQEPSPEEPLAVDGTNVTGLTFGTLTAAHVDGLFNNASQWEHLRGTHISYTAGEEGAVMEMFLPWEEFDAQEVITRVDETGEEVEVETGLYHPFAPSNGDVWLFNVSRQSSEPSNFLPQWHWTSSLYFASHGIEGAEGHGELVFSGAPDAPSFLAADFNKNGTVDFPDFLVLSEAFGSTVDPAGTDPDIDGSGTVDFADFLVLSESFGQSSAAAAAVPEPSSLALLFVAALTVGLARRRRSQ